MTIDHKRILAEAKERLRCGDGYMGDHDIIKISDEIDRLRGVLSEAETSLRGVKRMLEPYFISQSDALETVTDTLKDIRVAIEEGVK